VRLQAQGAWGASAYTRELRHMRHAGCSQRWWGGPLGHYARRLDANIEELEAETSDRLQQSPCRALWSGCPAQKPGVPGRPRWLRSRRPSASSPSGMPADQWVSAEVHWRSGRASRGRPV